ncbi:NYN domain-containing protein [Mariniblastus sp.]|nr:NYN domain-containing protein [Mariniblastus sp.]
MPTIIDGYNLIFTCGLEGKKRTPQSLEKARYRLISTVAAKSSDNKRSATTIVFDAKRLPIKETSADSVVDGIRILYAVDYEDADTLIEELIAACSIPKKLTVVSSDHRLQTAATRRKATAIDSDVWYDRLLSGPTKNLGNDRPTHHNEKQSDIQSLQAIDWAREFGAVELNDPETSDDSTTNTETPPFNPFPPGYGEDLTE